MDSVPSHFHPDAVSRRQDSPLVFKLAHGVLDLEARDHPCAPLSAFWELEGFYEVCRER